MITYIVIVAMICVLFFWMVGTGPDLALDPEYVKRLKEIDSEDPYVDFHRELGKDIFQHNNPRRSV